VKRREDYSIHDSYSKQGVSTGLWNSARLVVEMLNANGIEAKLVEVIDNNCIDREVTSYRPTDVIIEALWVVPEKFEILQRLHPTVKWNVRLHSEMPFVANEGIAMRWLTGYCRHKNVTISANSFRMLKEVSFILAEQNGWTEEETKAKVFYTPNYYMPEQSAPIYKLPLDCRAYIDVGCFGAIRPLKNQLIQAVAALRFADSIGKTLNFHINVGRIENKGDPVHHNIRDLFKGLEDSGHQLVEHLWAPHPEFLQVIRSMDIGMQVSFTETFNIVSADLVSCGIPLVASSEVAWLTNYFADPTSSDDIFNKMKVIWGLRHVFTWMNRRGLKKYSNHSIAAWVKAYG
jgi:hypothetical protein